ncbi:methyl-accepting chemotaxis protein [Acetanaerobacterium elongatum]|uniref:Methyl-accepting chemotaxis protein n=2 Tax=Acetanaerobacterium elongatum TaxID=258515 RepID=A0A1G9XWR9_9FIRM|nr:methyl-accepting chemotaxis protein [Acetanaerobacterium elongatum]
MLLCAVVMGLAITLVTTLLLYNSSISSSKQLLNETVKAYALNLNNESELLKSELKWVSANSVVSDSQQPKQVRVDKLGALVKETKFKDFSVSDTSGKTFNNTDISDRDYFKNALGGTAYISSPLIRKTDNSLTIMAGAKMGNEVLYGGIDYSIFSAIISKVQVGESGYGFVVDQKGTVIAHPDEKVVREMTNYTELAKKDASYADLAKIIGEMTQGKTGIETAVIGGQKSYIAYAPVGNPEGWSVGVVLSLNEVVARYLEAVTISALLLLVFIVLTFLFAAKVSKRISKPVVVVTERLKLLSEGDLTTPVPSVQAKDETGVLATSLSATVNTLNEYILEISQVLNGLADGNLRQQLKTNYKGDFAPIHEALDRIIGSLNSAFTDILQSAEQVEQGSEQIASGAQALSQSTMEQAAAMEEFSANIADITNGIHGIAQNAEEARKLSVSSSESVNQGTAQMNEMLSAMSEIDQSAEQISKIVKAINDIAFQTNILALNAAVEAARAGAAGKGFAVVADEVRNLAGKSAEASTETTALIEQTISAVNRGSKLTTSTAATLNDVARQVESVNEMIKRINDETSLQNASVTHINAGMETVSEAIQTNSATAEQSAASSEELSSQAQTLKTLISRFKF